jgi:hypothetical protein
MTNNSQGAALVSTVRLVSVTYANYEVHAMKLRQLIGSWACSMTFFFVIGFVLFHFLVFLFCDLFVFWPLEPKFLQQVKAQLFYCFHDNFCTLGGVSNVAWLFRQGRTGLCLEPRIECSDIRRSAFTLI